MPITTAFASPRRMASIAILRATPNDAQAAIGANEGPLILPIMEICEAGMLAMFHSRFGETEAHGSGGHSHFLFSTRIRLSFWRMEESFAEPEEGGTGSLWMDAASARYCWRLSLAAAQ